MRQILASAAIAAFLLLTWNAQSAEPAKKAPPKKTTAAKKTGAPAKKSASPARKSAPARKTGKKGASRTTWRNRQAAPTASRYREIQDALAGKGYLKPEDANGVWGESSVDALKRFQAEQKIESTGKINSLSLIALGLGPKHDSAAGPPALPVPDAAPGRM